jgi:glutathione S-transferase
VPVLIEGSKTYIEAAAIALHLLWKHRSPILPEDQGERESRIEWMMFANATVYMAYRIVFFVDAEVEEPKSNEKALSIAIERLNKLWEIVEHQLEKTNFLCGDTLSVGDIMLTVYSNWNQYFPGIKLGKNTKRMIQEVSSRESFKKALADEGSEFNVR